MAGYAIQYYCTVRLTAKKKKKKKLGLAVCPRLRFPMLNTHGAAQWRWRQRRGSADDDIGVD
jgi:hypothetical protein